MNQYVLDPSSTVDRVVFVSESIENIPQGFRARETYVFTASDQVEEILRWQSRERILKSIVAPG